ncbi:hypothetical protein [Chlamydia vaughanii]|uniref:hypothetical protein n=1 Tax=Chlamydia vaughanii TaxID=3112552 RepID=UPI0032B16255
MMTIHCQGELRRIFYDLYAYIDTNSTDTEYATNASAFYLDWCEKLGYPYKSKKQPNIHLSSKMTTLKIS